MRYIAVTAVLFVASACFGVEQPPTATRVIEGDKSTFPAKEIPAGVKALAGVLESCHSRSNGTVVYTAEDLKKALKGDHVRFVFPQPSK